MKKKKQKSAPVTLASSPWHRITYREAPRRGVAIRRIGRAVNSGKAQ